MEYIRLTEADLPTLTLAELRSLLRETSAGDHLHNEAINECLRRTAGINMIINFAGMSIIICIAMIGLFALFN